MVLEAIFNLKKKKMEKSELIPIVEKNFREYEGSCLGVGLQGWEAFHCIFQPPFRNPPLISEGIPISGEEI